MNNLSTTAQEAATDTILDIDLDVQAQRRRQICNACECEAWSCVGEFCGDSAGIEAWRQGDPH